MGELEAVTPLSKTQLKQVSEMIYALSVAKTKAQRALDANVEGAAEALAIIEYQLQRFMKIQEHYTA